MKANKLIFIIIFLFTGHSLYGQEGMVGVIESYLNDVIRPLYAPIVALVFLVSALMNIGDIWGDHKNWKGFLSKTGIYVGIVVGIVVVFEFLLTLSA